MRAWVDLAQQNGVELNVCVAAALRRGVIDEHQAAQQRLPAANMHPSFTLSGLGSLAEAALSCDRLIQF
ncbi:Sulfurtransferase TusD [compost metagenome]